MTAGSENTMFPKMFHLLGHEEKSALINRWRKGEMW
jgi:hypothetical protein